MKLSSQLDKLGTETAFAVSAAAAAWAAKGNKVYPFHLGDINLPTPANIVEATNRMVAQAQQKGANAIVNIRFATSSIAAGAAELYVYGTAVRVQ